MREIKFRAKRVDNDRWVFGYFLRTPVTAEFSCEGQFFDTGVGRYCIVTETHVAHEIDIKTLGQYTCFKDKDGVEIYEGDIVNIYHASEYLHPDDQDADGDDPKNEYYNKKNAFAGKQKVSWSNVGGYFCQEYNGEYAPIGDEDCFVVHMIGNIYENPEILEDSNNINNCDRCKLTHESH